MNLPVSFNRSPNLPALSETPPEPVASAFNLRLALQIAGGLLLVLVLLAIFVPIGGAVLGSGTVGVESRVKRIAHPFGGVIAEINVGNGDQVKRGQLLIRLDDRVTGADATYSSLTVEQLLAQRARLSAEGMGAGSITFPPELTMANTDSARKAMADEKRLFDMRRTEESQLRAQLAARVSQLNYQIAGINGQIGSMRRQRALVEPERRGVKELWDKNLVTINRLNQIERTAEEMDGRIASLNSEIAQARSQITETQERAIQLGQTRRVEAGSELARVMAALNEQRTRSVSAGDQQNRTEIRAPYTGTVEKLAFAAIGEVVRPAEVIMEIVPESENMVVEVAVSPADIDQVREGQNARIRFSAFNLSSTPEIDGKVSYLAADRTEDREGQRSFYTVRVKVDENQLKREGLKLRSGMPADVHIETGDRSMLSYITKPLRDQFARSFRDN
jgi:HlyD family type I secretion membrane fusion protein